MAQLELDAQELATMAWFLETAVVSLKEALEEEEATEGVGDAVRARDLYDLEGLRERVQIGLGERSQEDDASRRIDLTARQLQRLERLAADALCLCRGERPGTPLDSPPALAEAGALEEVLKGVRSKVQGHPGYPGGEE